MKKLALRLILYFFLSALLALAPVLMMAQMLSQHINGSRLEITAMSILVFPPSQLASILHLRPTYLARARTVNFASSRFPNEHPTIISMAVEHAPIAWPYWFVFLTVYAEALRLSLQVFGGPPTKPEGGK
jgi:hypothetical protein